MKKTVLVVAAACAALALPACGQKRPPLTTAPPPPATPETPPPAPAPEGADVAPQADDYERIRQAAIDEIERMGLLADIHFDLDRSDLRDVDRQILSQNAEVLKKYDFLRITIEGHCDERGSVEYNLALGERRSRVALDYLVSLGVAADRLKTVSYGKEVPLCSESNEDCWSRNRRDHFAVTGKTKR
jgi:peptidoglycan-associated lipoprotein